MEKRQQEPLYLGFASQKGGVGKSTLAEVLASILYYEKRISLCVVDCDGTQESFYKLRERERALIEDSQEISEGLSRYFNRLQLPSYRILRSGVADAIEQARSFIAEHPQTLQLVIFDFPGHAGTKDLLELSVNMDYIISPIEADPQSLASGLAYARTIRDLGVSLEEARIRDFYLLWNKINRSASTVVIDHYTRYAHEEELSILDSRIYHTVKFSREMAQGGIKSVFRSSYMPPTPALRASTGLDEWVEEVIEKLNLKTDTL